jgi:hypothetical protein
MRIHAKLMRDETEIGDVHIALVTPDDPEPDDVCTYGWIVKLEGKPAQYSNDRGLVQHRHGDGAWTLVSRVLDKAGYGDTE